VPLMAAALPIVATESAIVLTRSMRQARRWIRQQRRGTERAGLVASSPAKQHHRPLASLPAAAQNNQVDPVLPGM
jgi:hypothetical protein